MLYTKDDPEGHIGKEFESGTLRGVCDQVEIKSAHFTNIETDEVVANQKIRLRLRPVGGKAKWTEWFPYNPNERTDHYTSE